MQEIISRLLDSPRTNLGYIFKDNSINDALAASYFLDNLSEEEIKKFMKKDKMRNLVLLDYLKSYNGDFNKFSDENQETLIEFFLKEKNYSIREALDGISTPEKQIASLAYLSFLENEQSRNLIGKSSSKEDLKIIYYFDYIYPFLSENRRNEIQYNGCVSEIIRKTVELYKAQILAEKIKQSNKNLESILFSIKSPDIFLGRILEFEKLKRQIFIYSNEKNKDSEVVNLLKKAESLKKESDSIIREKVNLKFNQEYSKLESEFREISNKKLLENKDAEGLNKINSNTKYLLDLLQHTGDDKAKTVNALLKNIREVGKYYDEFQKNKKKFDSHLKELKRNTKTIKNLSLKPSSKDPKWSLVDYILFIGGRAREIRKDMESYNKNKYFEVYLEKNKYMINRFRSILRLRIKETSQILDKRKKKYDLDYSIYKNSFFRFLKRSRIKKKLRKISGYMNEIEKIKN